MRFMLGIRCHCCPRERHLDHNWNSRQSFRATVGWLLQVIWKPRMWWRMDGLCLWVCYRPRTNHQLRLPLCCEGPSLQDRWWRLQGDWLCRYCRMWRPPKRPQWSSHFSGSRCFQLVSLQIRNPKHLRNRSQPRCASDRGCWWLLENQKFLGI